MSAATVKAADSDDDDFEEFEQEDWPETRKIDNSCWDEDWDTDEVDEAFAEVLRRELAAAEKLKEQQNNDEQEEAAADPATGGDE